MDSARPLFLKTVKKGVDVNEVSRLVEHEPRVWKLALEGYSLGDTAAAGGHLALVKWLHAQNAQFSVVVIDNAAVNDHIDVGLQWLWD